MEMHAPPNATIGSVPLRTTAALCCDMTLMREGVLIQMASVGKMFL